jgi:ribosomal protein S27AE
VRFEIKVPPICPKCGTVLERLDDQWYCPECARFFKKMPKQPK